MKAKIVSTLLLLAVTVFAAPLAPENEKQLRAIFSWPASFTEERVTLKPAQVSSVESFKQGPLNSKYKNMTVYTATTAGKLQGYAGFISLQEPDGLLCSATAGVRPDGTISKVVVFSSVKDNPLTKEEFLNKFEGLKVGDPHAWVHLIKGKMPQGSVEAIRELRDMTSVIVEIKGLDKGD